MKLMVSSMLSATIYSSVFLLLRHCQFLTKFMKQQWISSFCRPSNTKIVNTPLDRSAKLVLSVINLTNCSSTGIHQIRLEIWPEPDLARFQKWLDSGFAELEPKSSTALISSYTYSCLVLLVFAFLTAFGFC